MSPAAHITTSAVAQKRYLQQYYRLHAHIYDLTRWAFLFGRKKVLKSIPLLPHNSINITEIGCGTGFNLQQLATLYPGATITGIDISADMLRQAAKKLAHTPNIRLLEQQYGKQTPLTHPAHLILFSYSLSMINPQWQEVLEQALADLEPDGYIAVVDFHASSSGWFNRWMQSHNVRIGGHLWHALHQLFTPVHAQIYTAYGGVWQYFVFVGKKK